MLNYFRIIPAFLLLIIMVCSCDNGDNPEPFSDLHPAPYTLPSSIELPATEAGSREIVFECYDAAEPNVPIHLFTTSLPILEQSADQWKRYEESGLTMLPETVYLAAGYDCYPNDLDFGYTYDWVKVSTYKEPGTNKGVMRISWEANRSGNPRKILIYLGYSERVVIELTQK